MLISSATARDLAHSIYELPRRHGHSSEIRKRNRANPQVVAWFRQRQPRELYLSVLTLGELRRGVERIHRRDPTSATVLNAWLDRTLREFQDRIIGVDQAIADRWGRLGTPDPIPVIDGLIAARRSNEAYHAFVQYRPV